MWALGMVLACVYCGYYLFPSSTEYETIHAMVQIFGLPEADVLDRANYKDTFFTRDNGDLRLCTPEEYTEITGNRVRCMNHVIDFDAMTDQHRNMYEMHDDDDHKAFIDLLKRILEVNPQRRITPSQALEHDFITMKHLAGKSKAAYAAGCEGVMGKTPPSEAQVNPSASSSSSMSGSSNQSRKSSMSEEEIVHVREVPSAGSADKQSSQSSLNSSDSCEKPVFQENLEKPEDLQTDKDKAKISRKGNKKTEAFELMEGHYLVGNQGIYRVQEFVGEGGFGKVAKCTKLGSPEMYAIKIIANVQEGKEEFESMKLIQVLDPDENHLMKMYECFSFQNVICLVYEILEESLEDFLIKNECKATPLTYVRAIAQQMFQALKALKSIGVVHCDIKLDNIMFADKKSLKFKLIDFGLAVETKELPTGTEIQVTRFRAPEVILGLPLDESVDMWALGMVLACVYFGNYPFPSRTEYETIRAMVQIFGLPEADVLDRANYKDTFFTRDNSDWRLCTPEEYSKSTGKELRKKNHVIDFDAMTDQHRNMYEMHDDDDHKAFIDLLKRILEVNPQRRITPSQALEHDFITMKHLAGKSKAAYAAGCEGVMGKTPLSEAQVNPSASSSSSMSGSSNQSRKSSMSEEEIVHVREVPSAGSADKQSSHSSLNSSDSCEKPVFQENLEKPEDLQTDKDKAKISRKGNRKTEAFELMEGRNLVGNQGIYKVQEFLGEGSFGKVAKCTKLGSPEMYAIKIIANVQEGKEEFESMKLIQVLDPDENHLMKMYECFSFQNVICLVYEILEESLVDFLIKNECKATPLTYVRAIAQQMFQALKALKSIGVVHCDIKLDNIMFADKISLKFKLIDFGLAVETKELPTGTEIQATPFRAPEVILGLPLDESIDMWALGVSLATVYSGNFAFPDDYDYETIRAMVQIFGLPEEELLSAGLNTQDYFTWDSGVNGWRLYTAEEYTQRTMSNVNGNHVINLDQMTEIHRKQFDMYDDDDHKAFIDLLKRMLEVNPQRRITPSQALEHDFITMKHLAGKKYCQDEDVMGDRQLGRKKKNLSSDKHGS
uniref:Protein kinase domain-containing protein n=1 Tax=Oryzias latipes TaxID=8090 RepID=A0A3B3HH51_ORYLA